MGTAGAKALGQRRPWQVLEVTAGGEKTGAAIHFSKPQSFQVWKGNDNNVHLMWSPDVYKIKEIA